MSWWENKGKVYIGAILHSNGLFGLHEGMKTCLDVETTHPSYMCHFTLGRWTDIPSSLYEDRVFMNGFLKSFVSAALPNNITTSSLEVRNAK